ncbi:MAG: type II secretion system GspH family protein [Clostridium sp.]|nr:MAG: type II secretion system GspH family protein [Clostridium sp.]
MKIKKVIKKGFTLVELLAVIVVLAIIMIIAIPAVVESMNNAKKRFI